MTEVVCECKECGSCVHYRCVKADPIVINEDGKCMSYWTKEG